MDTVQAGISRLMDSLQVNAEALATSQTLKNPSSVKRYFSGIRKPEQFREQEVVKKKLINDYGWYKLYLQGSWEQVKAKDEVQRYITEDYEEAVKHEPRGLLLSGGVGTGKSTLAGLIAIYFLKAWGLGVHFIPSGVLFQKFFEKEHAELDRLMKARLVCIDDVGREYGADYPVSKFENWLEFRYAQQLPTFITSNMKITDLQKRPGWERIADRINDGEWMLHLTLAGNSMRGR